MYLNDFNITDLVAAHLTLSDDESEEHSVLKIRQLLSSLPLDDIKRFNHEIVYYPDVVLEPGDMAIIPMNCWHGYYSIGPRAGMTFRYGE